MSNMQWVKFSPRDWITGTASLKAVEKSAYIDLIMNMYETGAPLENDTGRLARMCGISNSAFKGAVDFLIKKGMILVTEGGLWSEKVDQELSYFAKKSEVGSQNANARWGSRKAKNPIKTTGVVMQPHCQNDATKNKNKNIDISSLRSDISLAQNHDFERDFDLAEEDFGIEDFGNSEALAPQPAASPEALTPQAPEWAANEPPPLQEPERRRQQAVASPPLEPTTEPLEWPEPPEPLEASPTLTPPGEWAGTPSRDKRTSELLRAWEMAALEELERERRASEIEVMAAAGTPPAVGGVQTRPQVAHPQEPDQRQRRQTPPDHGEGMAFAPPPPSRARPPSQPLEAVAAVEPPEQATAVPAALDPTPEMGHLERRRTPEPAARAQAEAAPVVARAPSKASTLKAQFEREFDEVFWPAVVRKVGKASAKKAFPKARAKASLEAIMSGLERYQASRAAKGTEIQFWAHPTTFLNAERWDDEPDPVITNTRKNNHEQHHRNAPQKGHHNRPKTFTQALFDIDERLDRLQSKRQAGEHVPAEISDWMWIDDQGEEDDGGEYPTINALPFISSQQGASQPNFV